MKIANIYQDIQYNDLKPIVVVLFETEFSKEIRIAMKRGTGMREHKSSYPIAVEVVEGKIDFGVEGQINYLEKGDLISLNENIPHDLTAKEDSIIRLTLTKK